MGTCKIQRVAIPEQKAPVHWRFDGPTCPAKPRQCLGPCWARRHWLAGKRCGIAKPCLNQTCPGKPCGLGLAGVRVLKPDLKASFENMQNHHVIVLWQKAATWKQWHVSDCGLWTLQELELPLAPTVANLRWMDQWQSWPSWRLQTLHSAAAHHTVEWRAFELTLKVGWYFHNPTSFWWLWHSFKIVPLTYIFLGWSIQFAVLRNMAGQRQTFAAVGSKKQLRWLFCPCNPVCPVIGPTGLFWHFRAARDRWESWSFYLVSS